MEKTCETCVYEYTCDWTPAAGKDCCENWVYEGGSHENICHMES